jgi:hypothetical protein
MPESPDPRRASSLAANAGEGARAGSQAGDVSTSWASLVRPFPAWVWLTALVAALLHMMPFWHAQSSARGEWTFTGNLTVSPDYMQYRVWERQTGREGPIVSNRFTVEPNGRHLPVVLYWAIGGVSRATGTTPEAVYAYSGAFFATVLVLLLYGMMRVFLPDSSQRRWPFLALVFGGGLGGHLKVLQSIPGIGSSALVQRLVTGPTDDWPLFEDYRSHYIVQTLFDSHFLLLWIVCVAAVYALYLCCRQWTIGRAVTACALYALVTVLHVYEGLTLVAISIGVALALWRATVEGPNARRAAICTTASVLVCYIALGLLFRSSGLPLPHWHAVNILAFTLFIAYPASWVLLISGGARYVREGGVAARFIVGWVLACTAVTLSGPFYPYPDRGTMTMQLPLMVATGAIFFASARKLTLTAAVAAVALFGATPLWQVARAWYFSGFRADAPFMMINAAHRASLAALGQRSDTSDILLAEPRDVLWLAPEFPGRLYVGHFFLTVDYKAKNEALTRAVQSPDSMSTLLNRSHASLLFLNADRDPARFVTLASPRLTVIAQTPVGTLFHVSPDAK